MNFTENNRTLCKTNFNHLRADEHIDTNGDKKEWEINFQPDSVSVLVENVTNNTFVLIEQYRRPMAVREDTWDVMIELVAWIVDKKWKALIDIASEEVLEEIWYTVDSIEYLTGWAKSGWQTTAYSTNFYATVSWKPWSQNLWASEEIIIHEVEKRDIFKFLETKAKQWFEVDPWIEKLLNIYAKKRIPKDIFMKAFE